MAQPNSNPNVVALLIKELIVDLGLSEDDLKDDTLELIAHAVAHGVIGGLTTLINGYQIEGKPNVIRATVEEMLEEAEDIIEDTYTEEDEEDGDDEDEDTGSVGPKVSTAVDDVLNKVAVGPGFSTDEDANLGPEQAYLIHTQAQIDANQKSSVIHDWPSFRKMPTTKGH